ncbi:MAG: hypothetical protein J7647_28245 [Cyanobacteria bacterium SBLK]|nr:hypothetical protein [Cyanobacteria bacterium SBLK]
MVHRTEKSLCERSHLKNRKSNKPTEITLNGDTFNLEQNDLGLTVRHYRDPNFGNLSQQQKIWHVFTRLLA